MTSNFDTSDRNAQKGGDTVPRLAMINDIAGFGRCSTTVSLPVISVMKVQVCPVPTPGGTILMEAHQQLEELILDRDTYAFEKEMGAKFASLVYEGKWFTPLREAEQAFIEKTQEYVTGEVKFKLYKGNIIKAGTTSPYSLYNENLASFTTGDLYDHHDAEGFINLFGLSLKVRAMKLQENEKKLGN